MVEPTGEPPKIAEGRLDRMKQRDLAVLVASVAGGLGALGAWLAASRPEPRPPAPAEARVARAPRPLWVAPLAEPAVEESAPAMDRVEELTLAPDSPPA